MKKYFIFLLLVGILMATQSHAYASYWIIEQNGEINVDGMSEIDFDIIFYNTGDSFSAFSWDTDLWIDAAELTPSYYINPEDEEKYYDVVNYMGFTPSSWYSGVFQSEDTFLISGFTFAPAGITISSGENLMATVTFDILDPDAPNSIVEADVLSLDNATSGIDRGFMHIDYINWTLGDASTANPDIVVATPIPGAALLLGSGLVGLIGIRRRKA
ncbi:MAG: hypothetical protein PVG39_09565 [Desulfobacteraceae bacterium]